jgi:hypothetical protein
MKALSLVIFFSATSFVLFGQTGPGGVGNSATNVLWLCADNGVYNNAGTTLASNGNDVQQWNDRSGSARNAIQNISGIRPNYFNSGGGNIINGSPVISMKVKSSIPLSAQQLLPGIYLVKIKHGEQVFVRKLVVE